MLGRPAICYGREHDAALQYSYVFAFLQPYAVGLPLQLAWLTREGGESNRGTQAVTIFALQPLPFQLAASHTTVEASVYAQHTL
jgi:hypothetical protein